MNCIKCKAPLPEGARFCHMCGKKQEPEKRKALKRANGTGTVYKMQGRRSRPWVAAKNRIIIGYYAKKTDAIEALERLSGKDLTERYNMTFAEVYEEWKFEHFKEIGPDGIVSYKRAFDVFEPIHNRKFRELKTKDFQDIIDKYKHQSYSTISKHKQLITQMSSWAMREEIITTNFAKFVKLKENTKKEKEIFSDADIKKLKEDGTEASMIVLMLIYTGMRINELFTLPDNAYHEKYVVGGEKTDAGRNRVIPIMPEGREYFKYFHNRVIGEMLLSGYSGQKIAENYRKRDYYPLLERIGISKKTPHSTRHTFTSMAVKKGMQPEILQKILGHKDYSTTANIYTHIDIDTIVKSVE